MRLMFIRHGEPDYEHDSLTEKGWREAKLLVPRLEKLDVKEFFVSPMGRAKDTASPTLTALNRTAQEKEWLHEFRPRVYRPHKPQKASIAWDWLPQDWTPRENFFLRDNWYDEKEFTDQGVKEEFLRVCGEFDRQLSDFGYVRDGYTYRVERPNRDTYVFFCHHGIILAFLSHLMNVSTMVLWHHIVLAPSSVTTLYTEERRKGIAQFRAAGIGEVSHLYAAGEEPSFAARFCETFDSDERHD